MKKKNMFRRFEDFIVTSFREYNKAVRYCFEHNLIRSYPDMNTFQIAY